jgi:hypothetical protein
MQFVTISDHNCIDGALEIAHLPGVFIGNEVTAYFPDDGCKVHVLTWGLTEARFEEIERLRTNIVELRDYLHAEGIVHACAHPLYSVNDRLTLEHFERLLVLFNVFETMNGGRNRRGNDLVASVLAGLTPEDLERMADRHNLAPVGHEPWRKGTTGGSDDHSGVFIAKGFTECPEAATPSEFLQHVAARRSRPGGLDGTPLSFAHSLYSIGYQYYSDKFLARTSGAATVIRRTVEDLFGESASPVRFRERVTSIAGRLAGRPDRRAEIEFQRMVSTEMTQLFGEDWLRDDFAMDPIRFREVNQRTFELASRVSNELFFQFSRKFVSKLSTGSVFGSLEALSAVGPVILGVAPYLFAFAHQNRDKAFLAEVRARFHPTEEAPPERLACFVDATTHADVDGLVAACARLPEAARAEPTIITFGRPVMTDLRQSRHFPSVGDLQLPDHDTPLAFPPVLDLLDYCDQQQFSTIVVAAPSLAGLAMLAVGRMLGARLVGVYQTDLPAMVLDATGDDAMEGLAWRYVRWFYDQTSVVYVPDDAAARTLRVKGLDGNRLQILPAEGRDRPQSFRPARTVLARLAAND